MSYNHWERFKSIYKKKEQSKLRREVEPLCLLKGIFQLTATVLLTVTQLLLPKIWKRIKCSHSSALSDIISLNKTTQDFGCTLEPNGKIQVLIAPHTLLAGHREI